MAIYVENYGGLKIIIKPKHKQPHSPFAHVIKQQELHAEQVLSSKTTTVETLNRISFCLFFIFSLITLACTIYTPHCISFVYEYLGRAPVLWCNWSQWTAQFSTSTTTSRESRRGGGDTAPRSRPIHDRVETSQANRNWIPKSFFTSTGKTKSNKWTPEKHSCLQIGKR